MARRTIATELIEDARKHIYQAAFRTPLVPLNYAEAPCKLYLKLENLQPIGSFKMYCPNRLARKAARRIKWLDWAVKTATTAAISGSGTGERA